MLSLNEKVRFIEAVFGPGRLARNSLNIDVRCPACAPRDASKRKLSIRLDDDRCHCWVCGLKSATLAPLIKRFSSADLLIDYKTRVSPERAKLFSKREDEELAQKLSLPTGFSLLALAPDNDPDVRAARLYLERRGFDEAVWWRWRLGIATESRWYRRVIVPSFDLTGTLSFFVARAIDADVKPKYDSPGADRLQVVFNEIDIDWSSRVVLVEGTFDAMKCGDNAIPLLGCSLNEQSMIFNKIVMNLTPVALALDSDVPSWKVNKIVKKLQEYDVQVSIVDVGAFGDPGNASREQAADAIALSREATWDELFKNRLEEASKTSLRL